MRAASCGGWRVPQAPFRFRSPPRMSTGASDAATRAAVRSIESSAGSLPTMSTRLNPSVSGADVVVPASCNAVSTRLRNMRFCQGLVMKSNAPRRIPSTARGMLPQPVIRITGTSGRSTLRRCSSSSPSSPEVVSEKFMSMTASCRSGRVRAATNASSGDATASDS